MNLVSLNRILIPRLSLKKEGNIRGIYSYMLYEEIHKNDIGK